MKSVFFFLSTLMNKRSKLACLCRSHYVDSGRLGSIQLKRQRRRMGVNGEVCMRYVSTWKHLSIRLFWERLFTRDQTNCGFDLFRLACARKVSSCLVPNMLSLTKLVMWPRMASLVSRKCGGKKVFPLHFYDVWYWNVCKASSGEAKNLLTILESFFFLIISVHYFYFAALFFVHIWC